MNKNLLKVTTTVIIILLVWSVITGVRIWNHGEKDLAQESDCIIVLGAAVYGDQPSPVFKERIKHGVNLLNDGMAERILFTGGFGNGASHAESEVGAEYAMREGGVEKAAILTEVSSRTTRENLREANAIMKDTGLQTAIIVSDPLHLKRASIMADGLGMSTVTSPTPTTRYRSLKTKFSFLVREIYFYNHYLVVRN